MSKFVCGWLILSYCLCSTGVGFGAVIYVDNLRGDDAADGSHPTTIGLTNGPVRTIRRGPNSREDMGFPRQGIKPRRPVKEPVR